MCPVVILAAFKEVKGKSSVPIWGNIYMITSRQGSTFHLYLHLLNLLFMILCRHCRQKCSSCCSLPWSSAPKLCDTCCLLWSPFTHPITNHHFTLLNNVLTNMSMPNFLITWIIIWIKEVVRKDSWSPRCAVSCEATAQIWEHPLGWASSERDQQLPAKHSTVYGQLPCNGMPTERKS